MPTDEHQSRSCVLSWHSFLAALFGASLIDLPQWTAWGRWGLCSVPISQLVCSLGSRAAILGRRTARSHIFRSQMERCRQIEQSQSCRHPCRRAGRPLCNDAAHWCWLRLAMRRNGPGERCCIWSGSVRKGKEEDAILVILAPTSASPSHYLRLCRWLANATCGQPAFDLALIYFGASPFFGCSACVRVWHARGAKWNLVYQALQAEESWRLVSGHAGVLVGGCQTSRMAHSWWPWLPMSRLLKR